MAQEVNLPRIDQPLTTRVGGTMIITEQWYRFLETLFNRVGGDVDTIAEVDQKVVAVQNTKADKATEIEAGNGLNGGGDLSANRTISAKKDTGWTTGTGTPLKGAYATFSAPTIDVAYNQSQLQTVANAVQSNSERILAIEQALRANEAID